MVTRLDGCNILMVQGSALATRELRDELTQAGARTHVTTNLISAYSLLEKIRFHAAIIDHGLHNEAFDFCTELQTAGVPYLNCRAPHRLQGLEEREREAKHVVWKIHSLLAMASDAPGLVHLSRRPQSGDEGTPLQ